MFYWQSQKYLSLQPYKKIFIMILGTKNCITFMCKKLHAFVKVSIEIIPISFWAGPITENVNQVPLSLIKIYLLFKKMNEMIFTDSFSRELFRRLDLYY